ncbi:hypothetical protein MML48_2g00007941 [Holotrichia oblita]|uniref:Uncharacterized protein n=1 Tax=Holotrichia oblita TaxID=644536 RepID=A0ACB9TIJ2_HOLOL|nr:hypothetical protein MML48_2g00007941 [Holotrichia oblita]
MPKVRENASTCLFANKVNKFLWQFPDLTYQGAGVWCLVCEKTLLSWNRQLCRKHIQSATHKFKKTGKKPYNEYLCDLIVMLSACNVPVEKIGQDIFRKFWKKYNPTWKLPSPNTLRNNLALVRKKIVNYVKSAVKNEKLWLTMDQTTDTKKNSIVSILVRVLSSTGPSHPYLLVCKRLQKCTSEAVYNVLTRTLENFDILPEQVIIMITDGVEIMLRTGLLFKAIQPKLLHITCLLHALHLVEDTIRESYSDVDQLIGRIKLFHSRYPGIPKPSHPPISWLETAFYYFKYFERIKSVILKLDAKEVAAIKLSQMQNPQIGADLQTIHDNYIRVGEAIKKLQDTSLSLQESCEIVDDVETSLHVLDDEKGVSVREKFYAVLSENVDFTRLRQLFDSSVEENPLSELKDCLNYAIFTTLDVERSFSAYKQIYTPKRTNLKETTVETYVMLHMFCQAHPGLL